MGSISGWSALNSSMPLMRGITRSVTTIEGQNMCNLFERLGAVGRGVGREPPRPFELGQAITGRGVVFDDQTRSAVCVARHFF